MASAPGISHVTESLRAVLANQITDAGPFAGTQIDLRSPKEIGTLAGNTHLLSLWLYRVERFGELENQPPRLTSDGLLQPAPLPLLLRYLLTPMGSDVRTMHRLLGLGMQVLDAHGENGARVHPCRTDRGGRRTARRPFGAAQF